MVKVVKEGVTLTHKDAIDLLVEFSCFKDRVEKKFKELSHEFDGRNNEHELWVNLYLISTDYADELASKKRKDDCHPIQQNNTIQKVV